MKFKFKALAAALALAVTLPAHAAIDSGSTGNGSFILTLLDRTGAVSAAFDLGINYSDFNQNLSSGPVNSTAPLLTWNLAAGDYASAWTTYTGTTATTLANTLFGVVATDNLGAGAGSRGVIATYAGPATGTYFTTALTTMIGNVDTYTNALNALGNNPTVLNGASSAISGQGYAASALFSNVSNKLSNGGSVVLGTIGSSLGVFQSVNGANAAAATATSIFGNNAQFSLSNAGVLTYSVQTAAIPEADTSAMMLVGLGLMGFIARRRKSA
jgi:hypothetical protein